MIWWLSWGHIYYSGPWCHLQTHWVFLWSVSIHVSLLAQGTSSLSLAISDLQNLIFQLKNPQQRFDKSQLQNLIFQFKNPRQRFDKSQMSFAWHLGPADKFWHCGHRIKERETQWTQRKKKKSLHLFLLAICLVLYGNWDLAQKLIAQSHQKRPTECCQLLRFLGELFTVGAFTFWVFTFWVVVCAVVPEVPPGDLRACRLPGTDPWAESLPPPSSLWPASPWKHRQHTHQDMKTQHTHQDMKTQETPTAHTSGHEDPRNTNSTHIRTWRPRKHQQYTHWGMKRPIPEMFLKLGGNIQWGSTSVSLQTLPTSHWKICLCLILNSCCLIPNSISVSFQKLPPVLFQTFLLSHSKICLMSYSKLSCCLISNSALVSVQTLPMSHSKLCLILIPNSTSFQTLLLSQSKLCPCLIPNSVSF